MPNKKMKKAKALRRATPKNTQKEIITSQPTTKKPTQQKYSLSGFLRALNPIKPLIAFYTYLTTKKPDKLTHLFSSLLPPNPSKNSPDTLNTLLSFFSTEELILLFTLSKQSKTILTDYFAAVLTIPWRYYKLPEKKYPAVRDHLVINHLKKISRDTINANKIERITTTLKISTLLLAKTCHTPDENSSSEWKTLFTHAKKRTHDLVPESKQKVRHMLANWGRGNPVITLAKLTNYFVNETAIVTSFDFPLLTTDQNKFLNYFQTLKVESMKVVTDVPYVNRRLTAEFLNIADFPTDIIQAALANPAFCYGTLQDRDHIEAITQYGYNFVVFRSILKNSTTAVFGAPLDQLFKKNQHQKPVTLCDSLQPLLAQLPQEVMNAYLEKIMHGAFPAKFTQQYSSENTTYIETQFQRSISLTDSEFVGHIHFDASTIPPINELNKLDPRISYSIGNNPFENPSFTQSYFGNHFDTYLFNIIMGYIYQAALIIGETDRYHLEFFYTKEELIFTFKITQSDASGLHQAQAAAILYLLGVRKYFEKTSAILLSETRIRFVLPLSGIAKQEGGLTDHDAYTNDPRSLTKLLNIFIKRIIGKGLESKQNEEHLLKHNKPHPLTGRGAVEEVLQTAPLQIAPDGIAADFSVHWSFDTVLIEGSTPEVNRWIHEKICGIFAITYIPQQNQKHVLISNTLYKILNKFREKWICYKTVIIHDEDENPGNIFLALRQGSGFSTEGGKHLNPLSTITVLSDLEFMRTTHPYVELEKNLKVLGASSYPTTAYYLLPSRLTDDRELDTSEFAPNSLLSFPIYTLGNLTNGQLNIVCALFKITRSEYESLYGRALPLAPYRFLDFYLEHYEKELAQFFSSQASKNESYPIKVEVRINKDYKQSAQGNLKLPGRYFGTIEIKFAPVDTVRKIEYLLSKLKGKIVNKSHCHVAQFCYEITGVNPHEILTQATHLSQKLDLLLADLAKYEKAAETTSGSGILVDPEKLFLCLSELVKLDLDYNFKYLSSAAISIFINIVITHVSKIPDDQINDDTLRMLRKLHPESHRYLDVLIEQNRLNLIKRLMDRMWVNVNLPYDGSPLLLSSRCLTADYAMLEFFGSKGYDVHTTCFNGQTLLHVKASQGDLRSVQFLVNTCKVKRDVYYLNEISPLWAATDTAVFEFLKSAKPLISAYQHLSAFTRLSISTASKINPENLRSILVDVLKYEPELNFPAFLGEHAKIVENLLKIDITKIRDIDWELQEKEHKSDRTIAKFSFLAPVSKMAGKSDALNASKMSVTI